MPFSGHGSLSHSACGKHARGGIPRSYTAAIQARVLPAVVRAPLQVHPK
ncbi:hypothetical protein BRI9_3606 [plant metagenome]|uniref:Uncharacterized protein n=1 Tax=plant metagenome TaxID=1297885 RepID=A0A484T178_9ZZZZ